MKKYDFSFENIKYSVEFKILDNSLIITVVKNNDNINEIFKKEFIFEEIFKMNEKYKEYKNKDGLINILYNDIFLDKEKEIEINSNNLILNNKKMNIKIIFEKVKLKEDELINDIFNVLSSLENQVNQFTNDGQKLTDKLQNNLNQFENIISDYKNKSKY